MKRSTKHFLLYCLLTIPFLLDRGLLTTYNLKYIGNMLQFLSAFMVVMLFFASRRHKFNYLDMLFFVYELYLLINSTFNGLSLYATFRTGYIFDNIIIFMLYQIGFDDADTFIKSQFWCMFVFVCLDLASIIIFPNGMWRASSGYTKMWFWGYYNTHSRFFVMAIFMTLVYSLIYDKFLAPVIMFSAIWTYSLLAWSGGTLAFLAVTTVLIIMYRNGIAPFSYFTWWIVPLIFLTGIAIFTSSSLGQYVYVVSETALGKGESFLSRVQAWKWAIYYFLRNPIFGYGILHSSAMTNGLAHAHNLLLEMAHQGGLISLSLFASLVVMSGRKLRGLKSAKLRCAITIAFAGWIIITLVEPYMTPFLVALFVVAFRSSRLDKLIQESTQKQRVPAHNGLYPLKLSAGASSPSI